ncbi:MAG: YeeE/YedE family protein [Gemmatimonadota bacterium]
MAETELANPGGAPLGVQATGAGPARPARRPQMPPLALSLLALAAGAAILSAQGWRYGALFAIGALLGVTLLATGFGFTSGYRRAILHGDFSHLYAQLLMLAVATALFAPVLSGLVNPGRPVAGALAPAGAQVAIGAFLFGIGMQLGDGCGSGTLYGAGGGSTRNLLTLVAFCGGAFLGSLHMMYWSRLPSLGTVSLADGLGWPLAVALQLLAFAAIAGGLGLWTRRRVYSRLGGAPDHPERTGSVRPEMSIPGGDIARWLRGHRVLVIGGLSLAVLNFLTLLLAGHPWTITWAFSLWGAKGATLLGWDPASSGFWSVGFPRAALSRPIARDVTSVMDVGIVLGALAAAAWRGRYRLQKRIAPRPFVAAILAGLLLGYGARVAFGCNIGAFFSGVASGSLHGWLWIAAAFPGTWVGTRLRPRFGLPNEAPAC